MNETLQGRQRRVALSAAAGLAAVSCVAFLYRKEGKRAVVEELSDVASRSLSDEKMQAQAQLVTIQTLQALLEHEETVQRTVGFLAAVSEHEQTREAVVSLLATALKNPTVINEALQLVLWILDDDRARENLVSCLIAALTNPRFEEAAAAFAVRWLAHDSVRETVSSVFKTASLQVLEDDSVRGTSEQFVQDLLLEPQLQAKTSQHLWAAVKGLVISPKQQQKRPVQPAVGTIAKAASNPVAPAPPPTKVAAGPPTKAAVANPFTAADATPPPPAAAMPVVSTATTAPEAIADATAMTDSALPPQAATASSTSVSDASHGPNATQPPAAQTASPGPKDGSLRRYPQQHDGAGSGGT